MVIRNLAHTPVYLGGLFEVWQNAWQPDFETVLYSRGFPLPTRPEELVTTDVKDLGSIATRMNFAARIVTEIMWFPPPLYESRSRARWRTRCYLNSSPQRLLLRVQLSVFPELVKANGSNIVGSVRGFSKSFESEYLLLHLCTKVSI